jgi:predicted Zn finger-like uncharacterized protein
LGWTVKQNSVILPDSWLKLFLDFSLHSLFITTRPMEKIEGIFMRIVCPNCASQYEVAADAIPEAGRDVQCAKCAEIWFQNSPMQLTLEETPLPLETPPASTSEPSAVPEPQPATEPEAAPEPEVAEQEETASEVSAVFRSLRADRDPAPAASVELEQKQRQSISPEIQSILQQEAAFAASQQNQPADDEPATEVETVAETPSEAPAPEQPSPEQVAPQPDVEELSRQMRVLEEERDQLVRKQAEMDPSESVTLASAKSLRDILESEAIDPIDVTDAQPAPAMPEPSLETLGFKRPTPIIQSEEVIPTFKSAASYADQAEPTPELVEQTIAPMAETTAKTGKAVFADIDELNPNIEDDETDKAEDDLVDFQDDEHQETASNYSIGFLAAFVLAMFATTLYMFAPKVAASVPAVSGFMTAYHTTIDEGRMVLQDMYYQGGEPGFDTLLKNAKDKLTQ